VASLADRLICFSADSLRPPTGASQRRTARATPSKRIEQGPLLAHRGDDTEVKRSAKALAAALMPYTTPDRALVLATVALLRGGFGVRSMHSNVDRYAMIGRTWRSRILDGGASQPGHLETVLRLICLR